MLRRKAEACAVASLALMIGNVRAAEVSPGAVAPYTAESHPKVALKWGLEALPRINELRVSSAQRVAASRDCDRVTTAELFDLRSESADHWTILVECTNGRRFYLRQSDQRVR